MKSGVTEQPRIQVPPLFADLAQMLLRPVSLVLLMLVLGCAPGMDRASTPAPARQSDQALLTIYLETRGECPAEVILLLENLVLHGEQGDLPLYLEPFPVESRRAQDKQLLIATAEVPPGQYGRLELSLGGVTVEGRQQADQDLTLRLSDPLVLEPGDSQCLFVTWHLDDCLTGEGRLRPNFGATGQGQPLSGDLLYALVNDIRTLYLVRTDTRFVTAALGLEGRSGELAIDADRRLLYLVASDRRSLQVFDLTTHRLVDRFPLPLTLEPVHLALDTGGNRAFVSDPKARRVIKIDLSTGQVTGHQQVGLQPERLIYFEFAGNTYVAVCAPRSQEIILLNAANLSVQGSYRTGQQPVDLLALADRLYVAEAGSRMVTIFPLPGGAQLSQVRLTGAPAELLAGTGGEKIYVSLPQEGSLAVLTASQLTRLRGIPAGSGPRAMALSTRRELLFAASPATQEVTVLDQAAEREIAVIPLGGRPVDLAVFE